MRRGFSFSTEDRAAQYIRACPAPDAVRKQESINTARKWVSECSTSHRTCRKYASGARPRSPPKRFIHLGDDCINLTETQGHPVEYLALSYCWGPVPHFQPTRPNLPTFLRTLPTTELPLTIQDAIEVTQRLGYRYLWVDALCIVQDDPADKAEETSRMHNIYQGASLTLCAASAEGVNEGFWRQSDAGPRATKFTFCLPSGQTGRISIVTLLTPASLEEDQPWIDRGWTLQESLLSPRLLLFCNKKIVWRCRDNDCKTANDTLISHDNLFRGQDRLMHEVPDKFAFSGTRRIISKDSSEQKAVWIPFLHEFTRRTSTRPQDRLPIIQGIAMGLQRRWHDTYVFGTWTKTLRQQLVWQSDHPSRYRNPSIPTWLWASVDGRLTFTPYLETDTGSNDLDEDYRRLKFGASLGPRSALQMQRQDACGATSLTLTLTAKMMSQFEYQHRLLDVERLLENTTAPEQFHHLVMFHNDYWDTKGPRGSNLSYILLGVAGVGESDQVCARKAWVLIVHSIGENRYARVGMTNWICTPYGACKEAWRPVKRQKTF
ncbi:hypothetical protein H2200_009481 [Cladophialophora chaetospira]|uniref:Heterokaryon incompatibility domain-containing protein n=1 Tax=Cladophialophora chaetospira TaxID=386627 RepID=A0AA39CEX1_9EURO|nr:hypothetical protein H2200_009481 [Cladophialophora chaetospira]